MKRIICIAVVAFITAVNAYANTIIENTGWELIAAGTRGNAKVETISRDGKPVMVMTLTRDRDGNTYATALLSVDLKVSAEDKLQFTCKGVPSNGSAYLCVMLAVEATPEWKGYTGPGISINKELPENCVQLLGKDLGIAAGTSVTIKQIKFAINNTSEPLGHQAKIEITDLEISK